MSNLSRRLLRDHITTLTPAAAGHDRFPATYALVAAAGIALAAIQLF